MISLKSLESFPEKTKRPLPPSPHFIFKPPQQFWRNYGPDFEHNIYIKPSFYSKYFSFLRISSRRPVLLYLELLITALDLFRIKFTN